MYPNGYADVYPRTNGNLLDAVRRHGALVSEYFLGEAPLAWHFAARNRIIAGLASAVVVEAPEQSGALITVRHGLDAERDVWAHPDHPASATAVAPTGCLPTALACSGTSPSSSSSSRLAAERSSRFPSRSFLPACPRPRPPCSPGWGSSCGASTPSRGVAGRRARGAPRAHPAGAQGLVLRDGVGAYARRALP